MAALEKIGGRTFSFGMMPAVEALQVEIAIGKVIGEPLFKMLATSDSKASNKEKLLEISGAVIGLMASRMDAAEIQKTIETVLTFVTVDGARINLNSHFTGRPKEVLDRLSPSTPAQLCRFFRRAALGFKPRGSELDIDPVIPPNVDWFLYRPIMNDPPLCSLRELRDGTYSLNDLCDFHEVLDCQAEMQRRVEAAQKRKK